MADTLVRRRDTLAHRLLAGTFQAVLIIHAVLLVAQPFSAGAVLDGSDPALGVHAGVGGTLLLAGMIQAPIAVLLWRPYRWPFWPVAASTGMVAIETLQLVVGQSGTLGLHIPLGIATLVAGILMAVVLRPGRRYPGD